MANMREIRTRIKSVQDTMKITNAMYLISSAKLRKARSGREDTAPYFETLKSTIADILRRYPDFNEKGLFESEIERNRAEEEKDNLFIVISSDKGLAGSYNHNVFNLVEEHMVPGVLNKLLLIGRMGINYFKNQENVVMEEDLIYPATTPSTLRAREIAKYVIDQYESHKIDKAYVVYTKMINSMSFEPDIIQILPLKGSIFNRTDSGSSAAAENASENSASENSAEDLQIPEFSPSPEVVLGHIVPNYVKGLLYGAMAESYACEQSARMTAMDNATTNAKEMIKDLSLAYNRVRQANITQEITEVVSGAQSER